MEIPPGFPVGSDFRTHERIFRRSALLGSFSVDEFDFAFDDFSEGNIRNTHARTDCGEWGAAAVQLFHALRNEVDQNKWISDNFRGLFEKIAFHMGAGKSRNWRCLLKRDDVFGMHGRFFFAQKNKFIFPTKAAGRTVKPENRLSDKPYLVLFYGFFREIFLLRHEVDPEFPQNDDGEPEKSDGDRAVSSHRRPESPAISHHPRENEKHRQGREDEPESAFSVVGEPLRGLSGLMHPDHREDGSERESNEQGGKAIIDELDFVHQHDDERAEENFPDVERREGENFIPRNLAHRGEGSLLFFRG